MYKSEERRKDTLWRTLIADFRNMKEGDITNKDYEALMGEEEVQSDEYPLSLQRSFKAGIRYLERLAVNTRRPFLSSKGYIGLVPEQTIPTDFIVILLGTPTPSVLRPLDSGTYRLIGQAYVHGIMFVEYLDTTYPPTHLKNVRQYICICNAALCFFARSISTRNSRAKVTLWQVQVSGYAIEHHLQADGATYSKPPPLTCQESKQKQRSKATRAE